MKQHHCYKFANFTTPKASYRIFYARKVELKTKNHAAIGLAGAIAPPLFCNDGLNFFRRFTLTQLWKVYSNGSKVEAVRLD